MEEIISKFNSKGFKASYFKTAEEAKKHLLELCEDKSVGMGGSMTLAELGWYDDLEKRGPVFWHAKGGYDAVASARNAEVYISSANALSKDGCVVNIDGVGNRVSSTIFGAKKVIFVCGTNKIADDMQAAIFRAKNIAAPKNAQRLGRKTPCAVKADKCYNCNSPERICRVTAIMTYPMNNAEVHIILIEGNWGY